MTDHKFKRFKRRHNIREHAKLVNANRESSVDELMLEGLAEIGLAGDLLILQVDSQEPFDEDGKFEDCNLLCVSTSPGNTMADQIRREELELQLDTELWGAETGRLDFPGSNSKDNDWRNDPYWRNYQRICES